MRYFRQLLAALSSAALVAATISCPAAIEDVNVAGAVPSGLDYSFCVWRIDMPSVLGAGEELTVPLEIVNTGRLPWLDDEQSPFYVSYHWKHPGGIIEKYWGEVTPLPATVVPGEIVGVDMKLTAPTPQNYPQYYVVTIDLVRLQRGRERDRQAAFWFEEHGWRTHDVQVEVVAR